jgi:hypothetical protein
MRLPKNPENWTGRHADLALARANHLYEKYERCVGFTQREKTDALYRAIARETAVEVCSYTRWRKQEAELLP